MPMPTVRNILMTNKQQYILDQFIKGAVEFSLRRLRAPQYRVMRARDDTASETDIGFIGEHFNSSGLLSWLGRNLVLGSPLGVDGNSDGVSDGWTYGTNLATGNKSVSGGYQVLEIVSSSSTGDFVYVKKSITCVAGNTFTVQCSAYCTSNVRIRLSIGWYDEGASLITTAHNTMGTYLSESTISFSATAPATAVSAMVYYRIYPANSGDTGSGYFRSSSVSISSQSCYVKTWYGANGIDAIQTTAANQPRIVNAGILDRDFDANKCNVLWPTFASASGVNIVSNGDFSNGTTGWTGGAASLSVSNNILSATGSGASANLDVVQNTSTAVTVGKRYFIRAKVKVNDAVCTNVSIRIAGTTGGTTTAIATQTSPANGTQYTLSGIYVGDATHTGNIKFYARATYANAMSPEPAENGKVMEVQEVVCVDVTEYGMPCMYFDGINHVLSIANNSSLNITNQPLLMNCVINNINQSGYIVSRNAAASGEMQYGLYYISSSERIQLFLEGSSRQSGAINSIPPNMQKIYSGEYVNNAQQGYVNGSPSGSAGTYSSTLSSRANTQIGARSNNADGTAWDVRFKGYISEIIINTNPSMRTKIENNQKKYYGIA